MNLVAVLKLRDNQEIWRVELISSKSDHPRR
jgi:hypothetical protein